MYTARARLAHRRQDRGRQQALATGSLLHGGATRRPFTTQSRTPQHRNLSSSSRPSRPPIRLILLDIFNTLLHPLTPPAHQYASLARSPRYSLPPITDEAASLAFKAAMKRMLKEHPNYGRETLRDARGGGGADEWWRMVIKGTVVDGMVSSSPGMERGEAERLYERADAQQDSGQRGLSSAILHRFSAHGKGYALFPDVEPFFTALAERNAAAADKPGVPGVRCVLASNSDERILGACEALGLGKMGVTCRVNHGRDGALLSYDLGHCKPSAHFFREALRLAGAGEDARPGGMASTTVLRGEEVLYVGDDLEEDARGARDSGTGMTGVWLDREGKAGEEVGIRRVENLGEVLELVEERERGPGR